MKKNPLNELFKRPEPRGIEGSLGEALLIPKVS